MREQNPTSKRRPSNKRAAPEPLDWRELAAGPALRGLSDVLASAAPVETVVVPPTVDVAPTVGETPTVVVPPTVGVMSGLMWVDSAGAMHEARRVHRVERAGDSMTMGEERFYQAVWREARADELDAAGGRRRVLSMGYDRLAKLARLDEKSVRQLIPRLVAKKILEVVASEDSASRVGRTYRIFGEAEILERQRAAGLEHVVKKARGVEFVRRAPAAW